MNVTQTRIVVTSTSNCGWQFRRQERRWSIKRYFSAGTQPFSLIIKVSFSSDEILSEVSHNWEEELKNEFCIVFLIVSTILEKWGSISIMTGHVMISWLLPACLKQWWRHFHVQSRVYMGIKLIHIVFWAHFWSLLYPPTFAFMIFREK